MKDTGGTLPTSETNKAASRKITGGFRKKNQNIYTLRLLFFPFVFHSIWAHSKMFANNQLNSTRILADTGLFSFNRLCVLGNSCSPPSLCSQPMLLKWFPHIRVFISESGRPASPPPHPKVDSGIRGEVPWSRELLWIFNERCNRARKRKCAENMIRGWQD